MPVSCGSCTLCCTLLEVSEIGKARLAPCPKLRQGVPGCSVYNSRPGACRGFACLWLESQSRANPSDHMGLEMRPDVSHVVMGPPRLPDRTRLYVHVDPAFPDAWKKGRVGEYLRWLVDERGIELHVFIGEEEKRIKGELMLTGTAQEFAELDAA